MVFQQILNGLTNGSIYALLAIGVTMIYKSLGMLNFAHGDTIMISAFICLTLITVGIPIPLAIVLTIIAAAFIGCCLGRLRLLLSVWRRERSRRRNFTGSWGSVHLQTF